MVSLLYDHTKESNTINRKRFFIFFREMSGEECHENDVVVTGVVVFLLLEHL
ncbi:hypothetical protein Bca101_021214 [Brassica carinata]